MAPKRKRRDTARFFSEETKFKMHEEAAKRVVLETLSFLHMKRPAYVEIYFLRDQSIKALNKKFGKKDKKTTVLSFKSPENAPHPEINIPIPPHQNLWCGGIGDKKTAFHLGEIYLAPSYISAEGENIERLIVHGLVHLLGYTHKGNRDRIRMEALEKRIFRHLKKIKVVP